MNTSLDFFFPKYRGKAFENAENKKAITKSPSNLDLIMEQGNC